VTPDQIALAAASLIRAEKTGVQTGLLSQAHPGMTMDDAYAVQAGFVAAKRAEGACVIGWKIGLTSRAMQSQLGIDTPDSGVLLDDMSFADGALIPPARFIAPRIEAEIAFVTRAPIAGEVTVADVLTATEAVVPALEILDTRIVRADPATGRTRGITDTISDNAANAGIVLGATRHAADAFDLRRVGAIVMRDGVVEETGLGAGVLNNPVLGIVWLARRLADYGRRIEAGQVILSGSFIRVIECPPGSVIEADFGDFGRVGCNFG
jgi:2-oxo-hept-3-ene-1,7-dioate hydratase